MKGCNQYFLKMEKMKRAYQKINPRQIFFLLIAVCAFSFNSIAQPTVVRADPALVSFEIVNPSNGNPVNAAALLSQTTYKLNLQVFNLDQADAIPDGTCY